MPRTVEGIVSGRKVYVAVGVHNRLAIIVGIALPGAFFPNYPESRRFEPGDITVLVCDNYVAVGKDDPSPEAVSRYFAA